MLFLFLLLLLFFVALACCVCGLILINRVSYTGAKKQLPTCSISYLPHSTRIHPADSYTQLVYSCQIRPTPQLYSLSHLFTTTTTTTTTTYRGAQLLYAPPVTSEAQTGCAAENIHFRLVRSYKARALVALFLICILFPFWIGLSYN